MNKAKITLVRSLSGRPEIQRKTVEALGFRKLNHSLEKELNPQVMGMIKSVQHLLKVENI